MTAAFIGFITAGGAGDDSGGGKARSLGRLAALGLPVPPAFTVGVALFRALRSAGPPTPARLETAADLAQLEAARAALLAAPWPPGFAAELHAAVGRLATASTALPPTRGFAVRSSGTTEDRAGSLAPGLFTSRLGVGADAVEAALREVFASYLTPAAWVYGAEQGGGAVIHPFIVGTSFGACAFDGGTDDVVVVPDAAAPAPPTAEALAHLQRAARLAVGAHGPSELEWVADGDRVLFLQLRAYQAPVAATTTAKAGSSEWTWDAAHNPSPLSPAQAGLVELVDARCRIGIRQQVIDGYLHFAPGRETPAPTSDGDPCAVFERVQADSDRRLTALAPDVSLASALNVYVAGYQGLYGEVGPLVSRHRRALIDFLRTRVSDAEGTAAGLLAGVSSVATQRHAAARAIAAAGSAPERQAALDAYVRAFGDESGCWDVAEPTCRETPARLLLLTPGPPDRAVAARTANGAAETVRGTLPASERARFDTLVAVARDAAAVGEDDDALFARLQAAVRRALLRVGTSLVARGALDEPADVFFLPLSLTATLDGAVSVPELRAAVVANRAAHQAARRTPPAVRAAAAPDGMVRGRAGAGGRAIGRAMHHPASTPPGPDTILIASTLLPTELPLLSPGALVVETGGVLGHVAAQARERGLPAVVAAVGACAAIPEGTLVLVDGDRGEVIRLEDGD